MSTSTFKGVVTPITSNDAVFFHFYEDDVKRWVPRSVCLDGDELEPGDTDIVIKDWWSEKEGLL